MAQETTKDDLTTMLQDWGGDGLDIEREIGSDIENPYSATTDTLPFDGLQVQKFVKGKIGDLQDSKVGDVTYTAGRLEFKSEQGGQTIAQIELSGTIYDITLTTATPSVFDMLTSETTHSITILPSTKSGTIGGTMSDFPEDYTWSLAVNTGSGYVLRETGICRDDNSFTFDIKPWVIVGSNRIKVAVTGDISGHTKSIMFTCNVTNLTFNCTHQWWKAWKQGESFSLGGIYFAGNIAKQLHIKIDNDAQQHYTEDFAANVEYITSAYAYNLTSHFPSGATTSGIHTAEVWITAGSVSTPHFTFRLMCVATGESQTAKLCCINEIPSPVVNYSSQTLFRYAVYGVNAITIGVTANDGGTTYTVIPSASLTCIAETSTDMTAQLEIATEQQTNVTMTATASVSGGNTETRTTAVDNSKAYSAVSNASFYMNTSLRDNGQANRTTLINNAFGATDTYAGNFTGFAWYNDGWSKDDGSVKCLSVLAGSTLTVPTMTPLDELAMGRSLTLEWKMKVSNVADYDSPVMSFMDTETFNAATTNGIIVYPTRLTVLNSSERAIESQSLNLQEEVMLHIVVVFNRGYKGTAYNLCRIYVNGVMQRTFQYSGAASFGNNAYLRIGQDSSDFFLYMLRWYNNNALEASGVLQNYLNALTDTTGTMRQTIKAANEIYSGPAVSYELCKAKGYNTMVIQTANDANIPDLDHTATVTSTLIMEYSDHPTWNWMLTNAPISGQGTTSMKYYRWNLRSKNGSGTVWTYADGTTTSKSGWFDGKNNHPKVSKITAKKNVASSQQGHKMGACAMYDELFKALEIADLPSGASVAVYQYPVMGFQRKGTEGQYTYEFIGLYTIGPDKGDSKTFGYDASTYPSFMSIEGPNHAPLGTRFLVPWTDAAYSETDETLKFGGEEAWDLDAFNDDAYTTEAQILALYEAEWKPAYEIVYHCSPWLASLSETGYADLATLNANINTFRSASNLFTTRKNEVATLYDASYNLIYYRNQTQQYEVLSDASKNLLTYLASYLGGVTTPTTAQLIAARKAKFTAEMANYYDKPSAVYHYCFCELIGATDNFAKNSYPFKFATLAQGGRWMWRQDDLDTILATDNNGYTSKQYYVEPGDVDSNLVDIFQGASSALWTLVEQCFASEITAMHKNMVSTLKTLATAKGIAADYDWSTVLSMFSNYFWARSAKYFPLRGYNEDALWAYIDVWQRNPGASYNGVKPLSQANGTQFEAEMQWSALRIVYLFSKYSIGGFNGTAADGLNALEFTSANAFTFNIKPSIWMYPTGALGATVTRCGRTTPAQTAQLTTSPSGDTNYYIKGLDYINELGDLKNLVLTSRGGSSEIPFSVSSKRLKKLKIGDATAENVTFNATSLAVSGKSVLEIDARNVTSLNASVNLSNCPRLRRLYLAGASVTNFTIPAGSKVTEVSVPDTTENLYFNQLPMLTNAGLTISDTAKGNITGFYLRECPNLSAYALLKSIMGTSGNKLRYVTLYMGSVQGTFEDVVLLAQLAVQMTTTAGYGRVVYDETNKEYSYSGEKADVQGSMAIPYIAIEYQPLVNQINAYFDNFTLTVTEYISGDLSMVDVNGNALQARETANCYVIKQAGTYRFPLVYGCAIMNGQTNAPSYTQQGAETGNTQPFFNYLNNQIVSPFIEVDTGIEAASAEVLLNDSDFAIGNFEFMQTPMCRYLKFDVTNVPALGGNIIIGIKDADGVVMWSWHLWAYPFTINKIAYDNGTKTYYWMDVNLGWVKEDADSKYGTSPYYNCLRKDPSCPRRVSKTNINIVVPTQGSKVFANGCNTVAQAIQNPNVSYGDMNVSSQNWQANWFSADGGLTYANAVNYWDYEQTTYKYSTQIPLNASIHKTVYDPCPQGYGVPPAAAFVGLTLESGGVFDYGYTFNGRFFQTLGYRNRNIDGGVSRVTNGDNAYYYNSELYNISYLYAFYFNNDTVTAKCIYYRSYGFCIIPVSLD